MAQYTNHRDLAQSCKSTAVYNARVNEARTLNELQRLGWGVFGPSHVRVEYDGESVASSFPKVNIDLLSPAFLAPETVPHDFHKGTRTPTDHTTFNRFVEHIANRNPWITSYKPGFTSADGYDFTYLKLSTANASAPETKESSRLRVWIQSGVHGSEPAGDQAVLALLGKMDQDLSWTYELLRNMDILILPFYNPDGIATFNRFCSNGIDLNRDHMKLEIPQSRHIRKIFCDFSPHIALDMHEYSAKARTGKYVHGSDVMFCAAKNLNVHSNIREVTENLLAPEISRYLNATGFRCGRYIPQLQRETIVKEAGTDGKIGRNAMGLTQCISFLCDVRGTGIGDQHFHRRTAAGLAFIDSVLTIAVEQQDLIRNAVEGAIRKFIEEDVNIVVKDEYPITEAEFTMIEAKTGSVVQLPLQFRSATPTIPTLSRSRPEAYAIPASLLNIAELLYDSGMKIQRVKSDWSGISEVLTIETAVFEPTYFEGIVPMTTATSTNQRDVVLEAGTFILNTRQKNAALAFIALEPENIDSYVSTNILPVTAMQEYPIRRVMAPIPLELVYDWSPR